MSGLESTHIINGVRVVSTTEMCRRLGVALSADKLSALLAKPPYAEMPPSVYWREDDVPRVALVLALRLLTVAAAAIGA